MADKDRIGRFLRALLGLFAVAWTVVAVLSPPSPLLFTVALVGSWVVAAAVAVALVYRDGYARLRASRLYSPGVPASTATGVFVLLALVSKIVLTAVANLLVGRAAVGYPEGAFLGVLALSYAYVLVFVGGALGAVWGTNTETRHP